jgi:type III restriction enzyme
MPRKKSNAADEQPAEIDRVPVQAVPDPILSSPFKEPAEHWLYEGGVPRKNAGRRKAGYYYKTERTGTAQADLFAEENRDDLPLVNALRDDVRRWRESGYRGASEVTKDLLRHWRDERRSRRLFFCQLEAVETLIYLLELRIPGRSSRTGFKDFELTDADLKRLLAGEAPKDLGALTSSGMPTLCDQPADPLWQPLRRLGCKMATGSGKTVVMAMTVAWAFCNRGRNPMSSEYPNAVLVCAPNLTVKNRLAVLRPEDPANYYEAFDIVPLKYREYLQQGKVLVTNWHVFGLKSAHSEGGVSYKVVDKGEEDERAFTLDRLGELAQRLPILVLNDEGHHCWRPKAVDGDAEVVAGDTAEERKRFAEELAEARVWLDGLDRINNSGLIGKGEDGVPLRGVLATIDLSATPFYLGGSGFPEGAPFPWLVSDFGLVDAIESGIVKIPRIPIKQVTPGGGSGPTDDAGRPDPEYFRLWDHMVDRMKTTDRVGRNSWKPEALYREAEGALTTLYAQWKQRFEQYQQAVLNRTVEVIPPAMIVVCPDTDTARLFYEKISGERTVGEGKDAKTVYDASAFPELRNGDGKTHTFRIDSKLLAALAGDEDATKDERVAQMREIIDTIGKPGKPGEFVRCVVSVSMLTEGWDANNVTQILGVRPFRSQLLCEQVVGRGLRRRSYAVRDNGMLEPEYVDVYGIPFSLIPFKGRETDDTDEPDDKPTNHVRAVDEKLEYAIEMPRVENFTYELVNSGLSCDVDKLPDLVLADEPVAVEVEAVRGYKDEAAHVHGVAADIERQTRDAYYANIHPQRIAFTIAQRVTQRLVDGQKQKPELERVALTARLFADIFAITGRYIDRKLKLKAGQDKRDLGFEKNLQRAVDSLFAGIQIGFAGGTNAKILPVVNRMRGRLRSHDVSEHTKRPVQEIEKSHLNAFAPRSGVETQVARALDWSEHVRAWVPNARGFDLRLDYEHDGQERSYEPDFVVELITADGAKKFLIIEVKGGGGELWDEQAVQSKATAAMRWCTAVNNAGAYGEWAYEIVREVADLDEVLARHAGFAPAPLPFRVVDARTDERWKTCVPRIPLAVAAGGFSEEQGSLFGDEATDWIAWDGMPTLREGMFVAKVISDSMEPLVPKDSWCLFKPYDGGSREGRNLLVTHQSISEHGFPIRVTLKRYHSEKVHDPATREWRHTKIVLKPLNPARDEIEIAETDGDDGAGAVRVVAELVGVIA